MSVTFDLDGIRQQASKGTRQRRFSGARRAKHHDQFPFFDFERNAI
jgi:hypothetical protein